MSSILKGELRLAFLFFSLYVAGRVVSRRSIRYHCARCCVCPRRRRVSQYRPVAQLAEQRSPKPQVGGSIPSWPASLPQVGILLCEYTQLPHLEESRFYET